MWELLGGRQGRRRSGSRRAGEISPPPTYHPGLMLAARVAGPESVLPVQMRLVSPDAFMPRPDQVLRHFRETSRRPFMVGPSTASPGRAPRTRGTAVCIEEGGMTTLAIGTSTRGADERSSREARVR